MKHSHLLPLLVTLLFIACKKEYFTQPCSTQSAPLPPAEQLSDSTIKRMNDYLHRKVSNEVTVTRTRNDNWLIIDKARKPSDCLLTEQQYVDTLNLLTAKVCKAVKLRFEYQNVDAMFVYIGYYNRLPKPIPVSVKPNGLFINKIRYDY